MLRLNEHEHIIEILEKADKRVYAGDIGSGWSSVAAEVTGAVVDEFGVQMGEAFEGTILYFPGVPLSMLLKKEEA